MRASNFEKHTRRHRAAEAISFLLVAAIATTLSLPAFAQVPTHEVPPVTGWTARHLSFPEPLTFDLGATASSLPKSIAISPNGQTLYVAGAIWDGPLSKSDAAIVAYDSLTGLEKWSVHFNGELSLNDGASAMQVSSDGNSLFVAGFSGFGATSQGDYLTSSYSTSDGSLRWSSFYDSGSNLFDFAKGLRLSPDGTRVFVTGTSSTVSYGAATGSQLWATSTSGSKVEVSPDGTHVYAAANSGNYVTDLDSSSGGVLGTIPSGGQEVRDIAVGPDGSLFIASWGINPTPVEYPCSGPRPLSEGANTSIFPPPGPCFRYQFHKDYVLRGILPGGTSWAKAYDSGPLVDSPQGFRSDDYPTSVTVSPDGEQIYLTGSQARGSNNFAFTTLGYRKDGSYADKWYFRYEIPRVTTTAYSPATSALVQLCQHWLTIAGILFHDFEDNDPLDICDSRNQFDSAYVKSRATHFLAGSVASDVVVSPDGKWLFVTGGYSLGAFEDFTTIAYDRHNSDGSPVWVARHQGGVGAVPRDFPSEMVVDSDSSRLFVTGISAGTGRFALSPVDYGPIYPFCVSSPAFELLLGSGQGSVPLGGCSSPIFDMSTVSYCIKLPDCVVPEIPSLPAP